MAGQKGDTCREENNADKETFFCMLASIKGFSFVWKPQVVTHSGVSFKMCWSAVMVSSHQSLRISCRNREYCLRWEMDFDIHFANAFVCFCDSVSKILNSLCCRTVGIHSNVAVFFYLWHRSDHVVFISAV